MKRSSDKAMKRTASTLQPFNPSTDSLPPRKRDEFGRFLPSGRSPAKIQNLGGFDGANWWSSNRGYVYYPTLDSKKDLSCYDLYELRKKSRWAVNNIGFASRCIYGKASMVGALTPVPQTLDTEWNLAALASFNRNASSPLTFDVGGRFDFWSCQPMITSCSDMDGDMLAVFTETNSGIASCMFYEAHQVDNSSETKLDQSQWQDGVRTNPQGRPIGYRIVTGDDYGYFSPGNTGQRSVDIPASDAAFICKYRRPGRVRGEPALRHAVNNLVDRSEIMAFTKTSIKNASMIGYQIVRNAPLWQGGPVLPPKGMGAGPNEITVYDSVTGLSKTLKAENPFGSGKQAEMDPGEEIKLLLDQRPHPNQTEFLNYLARDIAWGMDCSPDILWDIAKIGGAQVRYVMADAKRTLIEPAQQLLADQFCTRFWVYSIAKEMKAGRLRKCEDPEWFKVSWQPPADITVDIGRDGALYLDLHKAGLISLKRYHAQQGQNWQKEVNDYLDERAYQLQAVKDRGLTWEQAYPPEAGAATTQAREQTTEVQNKLSSRTDATVRDLSNRRTPPPMPNVTNVHLPPVQIPEIKIPQPEITVNLPEQKAPIVNVYPIIEPAKPAPAPIVNIEAPAPVVVPPPIVNVAAPVVNVEVKTPKTKSVKFTRDDRGQIVSADTEKE
jgi:capsid protein